MRVAHRHHDPRVLEALDQARHAAREVRRLAEVDAVRAVQIELAADAVGVEALDAAALPLGLAVEVVEVELAHRGQLQHPGARGAGPVEEEVVLLGLGESHGVDVLGLRVAALLPGLDAALEEAAEVAPVEVRERADRPLLEQRREVELVEPERAEALGVAAQQAVEQGGAAPRVADQEDRRADAHSRAGPGTGSRRGRSRRRGSSRPAAPRRAAAPACGAGRPGAGRATRAAPSDPTGGSRSGRA